MKHRQRPIDFSPRLRGNIIRAVAQDGAYHGSRYGIHFEILKAMEGVMLLVREGKRWRSMPALTVWDALQLIEQRTRNANWNVTDDSRASMAGGSGSTRTTGHAGRMEAR